MDTHLAPHKAKKPWTTLDDEELPRFLAALDAVGSNWGTAAHLMAHTGLRVGEVKRLAWRHLKLDGEHRSELHLTAEAAKNGYARALPLTAELARRLTEKKTKDLDLYTLEKETRGEPATRAEFYDRPVITKRNGKSPTIRMIQLIIATVSRHTLPAVIHPHTLRHTFATRLLRHTNLRVVQDALGHRSVNSTQIYTHPSMSDLREAIAKTEGAKEP